MFRLPNYRNNISLKLSEVLGDIGVNEGIVMKRRKVQMLEETMHTISHRSTGDNVTVFFLGSQTEGTTTTGLQSDFDIVSCDHAVNVIQDWAELKPGMPSIRMIHDETTAPGYCFLQVLKSAMTEIRHTDCIRDTEGRVLWKNTWLNNAILEYNERHGPSQAMQGEQGFCDKDFVFALLCRSWPQSATGWLERQSIGRWPTPEMKRYAVSNGCFVVAVGSRISPKRDLEWRISTSLAERCLMFNLSITQIRCYVLMKMLLKTFLNPKGDKNLSSFMCKTVLLHRIENTEPNMWQEHNLLTCLIHCLLTLYNCVQSDCCPHFILPGNNLMAGQFSTEVKHELLESITDLIQSDGQALLRIDIDELGERLLIKLNIAPELAYYVLSPADINEGCSGLLYINFAQEISVRHELILRENHNTETMKKCVYGMLNYIKHGNWLEQVACKHLAPFLYTTLGTSLASSNIGQNKTVSPEALAWISAGLNSDVSSSRMKLASVSYCIGDMEKAESNLRHTERQHNSGVVMSICGCLKHPPPKWSAEFNKISNEKHEDCIKHITAFCIRFLQCEINCVPRELQYEMFRSTQEDLIYRGNRDYWMDWAVADSLPYLYFLQYKVYGHLQRRHDQQKAYNDLERTIYTAPDLWHRETALNLLGQCTEQENRPQKALKYYMLSLQQRARNNAAKFHICRLLYSVMVNR